MMHSTKHLPSRARVAVRVLVVVIAAAVLTYSVSFISLATGNVVRISGLGAAVGEGVNAGWWYNIATAFVIAVALGFYVTMHWKVKHGRK